MHLKILPNLVLHQILLLFSILTTLSSNLLTTKKTKPVFPRNTKRITHTYRFLHTQPYPAKTPHTQNFRKRIPECDVEVTEKGFIRKREREIRVLAERRESLKFYFVCLVLENLFFYVHTDTARKQKRMIFLFVYFLYTNATRTIFLAYKRSITEESNNRLI